VYEDAVPVATAVGRFQEARRLAGLHWDITRRLSAHHRLHSVSLRLEIADTVGDWQAIVQETGQTVDAVAQNLATPCVRNARDMLLCALAHWCSDAEDRARELGLEARSLAGEGHERELNPPRLRIALVRGDLEAVRALAPIPLQRTFVWGPAVFGVLLDALAALRDEDRIEREAPSFVRPGTVVEPFALRALGIARRDDDLLAQADQRFAALGLEWHRSQTDRLVTGF